MRLQSSPDLRGHTPRSLPPYLASIDLRCNWFPHVTDEQIQRARHVVALVAQYGGEVLSERVWLKKGVEFLRKEEVDFLHEDMRDRKKYNEWIQHEFPSHNISTSDYDWNLALFHHSTDEKVDCWTAIHRFAEDTCKGHLRKLQHFIANARQFHEMHQQWIQDEQDFCDQVLITGKWFDVMVSPHARHRFERGNYPLDSHELQCQIVRALHHMDGSLLRPIIAAYMGGNSQHARKTLRGAIRQHAKKTEGVNKRDEVYLHYVLRYQTVFEALHEGLSKMAQQKTVWALEWCAEWATKILFWVYPRGPGYIMLATALERGNLEQVVARGLYPSLLEMRPQWEDMIRSSWVPNNTTRLVRTQTIPNHTQSALDQQIMRILAEYLIRERPWQLPRPHEKQLDSVVI